MLTKNSISKSNKPKLPREFISISFYEEKLYLALEKQKNDIIKLLKSYGADKELIDKIREEI